MRIDLGGVKRLLRQLDGPLPVKIVNAWAAIYSAFTVRRWIARGRGTWAPLKPQTIERKGSSGILIDTGYLLQSMNVGAPGNLLRRITRGIRFGFNDRFHPDSDSPISVIARAHQFGVPEHNLPARPILVDPDATTKRLMGQVVKRWFATGGR